MLHSTWVSCAAGYKNAASEKGKIASQKPPSKVLWVCQESVFWLHLVTNYDADYTSSHSGALLCLPAGEPGSPPHCWRPSRSPRRCPSPCRQTRQSGIWHTLAPLDPISRHHTSLHVSIAQIFDVTYKQTSSFFPLFFIAKKIRCAIRACMSQKGKPPEWGVRQKCHEYVLIPFFPVGAKAVVSVEQMASGTDKGIYVASGRQPAWVTSQGDLHSLLHGLLAKGCTSTKQVLPSFHTHVSRI